MNTIKVRFTDIRRWAASQLTGLAMTIYNDDDVSLIDWDEFEEWCKMAKPYVNAFCDLSEPSQEGLDEITQEIDGLLFELGFDAIINSFDDPVANAWKKLIPTQQAKQADTNEH